MLERIRSIATDAVRRAGLGSAPGSVVVACVCVALLAVVWAFWRWWPEPSQPTVAVAPVVSDAPVVDVPQSPTSTEAVPTTAELVVHVVGSVRRPGVYRIPAGSRVADAVDAAGGALADAVLDGVNLARVLQDGEQVLVPDAETAARSAGAQGTVGATPAGAPSGPVDINSATAEQLDSLPGIGPSTAAKILAERDANGPFASLDDLGRVSGIGEKKIEALKDVACAR